MARRTPDDKSDGPHDLGSAEINKLLSMTLIANLATIDNNGAIHIVPMWFLRVGDEICFLPLARRTSIGTFGLDHGHP